ncbi:MAG: cation transporter [Luteimonas sp.]|nr:cation transporter [Luteimonas sp.]
MSDSCCGRSPDVALLEAKQRRVLTVVMLVNLASCAMMLVAAWYSGSSSLLSGMLDNLGDAFTYLLSLLVVGAGLRAKARVAMVKGLLIFGAAGGVALQVAWRLRNPGVPLFEAMGLAALANLGLNGLCLWLLSPWRYGDVNLASAWECSRNDVYEGGAVLLATAGVWAFGAGWPDLVVAVALLALFLRSAWRVLAAAWAGLRQAAAGG